MILLNEIERDLLNARGRLLSQQVQVAQRIADKAQQEFNKAMTLVVKGRPMRERPPVDAKLVYDEAQGALVWDAPKPLPALPPAEKLPEGETEYPVPSKATADTPATAEV